MDSTFLALIALVLGLAAGAALGWFFGSRPAADLKARVSELETEAKDSDSRYLHAFAELEAAKERAKRDISLSQELERVRTERDSKSTELASLRSEIIEREKAADARYREREVHFERELKRLVEAEEKLQAKFTEIGDKLLSGAQEKFLETAHSRFEALNKKSLTELEKKVGPVGETLERFRKRVEEIEKNNTAGFHQLKGVISEVRDGQQRVLEGANKISTTLRGASKARGDWGELQLQNLIESCGLRDHTDFDLQFSVIGGDGLLRPDAIINIPGGRRLVVDVKNVFNTYAEANEAETEEQRQVLLRSHARQVRGHIDELSAKRYQDYVEGAADFVVLFIPGEHVLYAALSQDSSKDGSLLEYALQRNVVLSSPLNFMSIALTVATVWRQAGAHADAKEITELGKELYDRLARMGSLLAKVGDDLAKTNRSFNTAVASFESRLVPTGRKFEQLSIDTSAVQMKDVRPLEIEPRQLVHVESSDEIDEGSNNTAG
ncbi:MAG: DNA recombination protein RmuC [Sphingomonadaceae bacterium]|nr:DNA recombination protein RmuC [Sphingomonadaceae bacterium]